MARIRVLATTHGRNADWAEKAVREAANISAAEALELGVIEIIATDTPDLLRQAEGRTVEPKGLTLSFEGATIETHTLPLHLQILDVLIDPNLISIMFLAGLALIAFEVASPGAIFPGAAGGLLLVLSLFGISVLPFTWVGLLLLLLGAGLLIAEINVGHGALGAVGVVAFAVGALPAVRLGPGGPADLDPARGRHRAGALRGLRVHHLAHGQGRGNCPSPPVSRRSSGATARCARRSIPRVSCSSTASSGRPSRTANPYPSATGVVVERLEGFTLHVHPAPLEEVRS